MAKREGRKRLVQATVKASTKKHIVERAASEGRSEAAYVRRLCEQDETDWRRMNEAVERHDE